jgi:ribonuclease VapC
MLLGEPEAERLLSAIVADGRRLASAFTVLESAVVIESRKGESAGRELDLLLQKLEIEVVPLTASLAEVARNTWRKYGRGNHPAKLNLGDCCSFALAAASGEPLLFKGGDFHATDIEPVPY